MNYDINRRLPQMATSDYFSLVKIAMNKNISRYIPKEETIARNILSQLL